MLANVEDAVLLVAESLRGVLLAELLYYGDGRLKQITMHKLIKVQAKEIIESFVLRF